MVPSSPQFCDTCGAANRSQAQFCRVCGNILLLAPNAGIYSLASTFTGFLVPQSQLRGRYAIVSLAGRGGYGAVYKALDTEFGNRPVAVKEMSQRNLSSQELALATAAFYHEALLLANLTHPHLPRIYEQFAENGRSYLVMDFIDGETLDDHIKKLPGRRMSIERMLNLALQLCSVLEYLHTRQPPIIFRDLKPANIMITPAGHIFLIDFGIARHFKPGQKKDTVALGSSGYAPPEQYGKSQTTMRADIYSLGATLHELLSGHDPSDTPFHFEPLRLNDRSLSGLEDLILSMVSIDINSRPPSVSQVRQELERIVTQQMVQQTNPLQSSNTLTSIPAQPVGAMQSAATKRTPRSPQPPAVYPQANTLYICMGHTSRVTSIAWSPNGNYLASASFDKTVHIWNGVNGSNVLTYSGHSARVNALSWSPDNKYIVSASDDRTVRLWDAQTGKNLFTYSGHKGPVSAVAWSPDGNYIASADEDHTIHVWHTQTHQLAFMYSDHSDKVMGVAWSPNSRLLASISKDRTIKIHQVEKDPPKRSLFSQIFFPRQGQKTLSGFTTPLQSIAWSPDNRRIAVACADSRVRIRDPYTGTSYFTIVTGSAAIKNSVVWSPNGKYLAIGGNDKLVRIWNIFQKKEIFAYYGHNGYVLSVVWSPDGTRVASAGVDRSIQVWQAL